MLDIIVEVIALTGFPPSCKTYISSGLRTATYTATISIDDKVFLTRDFSGKENEQKVESTQATSTGGNKGNENLENKFGCKLSKTSTVTIKVECKHSGTLHRTHQISSENINVLDNIQLNAEVPIKLRYEFKKNIQGSGSLIVMMSSVSTTAELVQFNLPSKTTECMYTATDLEGLGVVSQILKSEVGLQCPEWINFLGSMGTLLKIAQPVKGVDPHAILALSAAEFAFELFMKQKERDERILGLVRTVSSLYQMILDSNPLEKCHTLSNSINDLISLTRECAYFIAECSKTASFAQRMIVNAISNADDVITLFEKQFFTLKETFFAGIILSIGQVNIRIMEKLERMDGKLDELVDALSLPVLGRSWNKLDGYVEGPQDALLPKIYEWGSTCDDTVPNIFLLLGGSKYGKSAVAHTVANFFHERGRLGATVFFDSRNADNSENFFPSIIRELSKYDPAIYEKVTTGLRKNPKFRNDSLLRQFDFLRDEVLSQLTMIGPTVIIVDGLDKCIDRIRLLVQLAKFPENIRLLITTQHFDELSKLSRCVSYKMKREVADLQQHIIGFLSVVEHYRPTVFANSSAQAAANTIYLKTFGIYSLAQGILEGICIAEDDEVLKLLETLLHYLDSEYPIDALEKIRHTILSILELDNVPKVYRLYQRMENPDQSVKHLVKNGYLPDVGQNDHLQNLSLVTGVDINAISVLNSCCRPSHCNSRNALQAVPAISNLHHCPKLFKESASSALHFILLCKCSYPPQATKEENKFLLEYLIKNHQDDCTHKPSTKNSEELADVLGVIQSHHTILKSYKEQYSYIQDTSSSGQVVYLTIPVWRSGLSTSFDEITLLKLGLYVRQSSLAEQRIEAAIYRAVSERGKEMLAQMQYGIGESKRGIVPFDESANDDVQVVKNPLDGKGSWFVGTLSGTCDVLWFNCPIPTSSRDCQYFSEGDPTYGHGFLNSLRQGDRIAIIVKSGIKASVIRTQITLFTDPKEECPPAKYVK